MTATRTPRPWDPGRLQSLLQCRHTSRHCACNGTGPSQGRAKMQKDIAERRRIAGMAARKHYVYCPPYEREVLSEDRRPPVMPDPRLKCISELTVEEIAQRLRELNEERIETTKREAETNALAAIKRAEALELAAAQRATEARRAAAMRRLADHERELQALRPAVVHVPHRLSGWLVQDIASQNASRRPSEP